VFVHVACGVAAVDTEHGRRYTVGMKPFDLLVSAGTFVLGWALLAFFVWYFYAALTYWNP
jgi:hypothetical protein